MQGTTLPTSLRPGETARIGEDITVTLQAMELIGPGEDPLLPSGQARLYARVTASPIVDWPALAPTLLLPSGQVLLPSETVATTDGADLAYLVPLPSEPLEVAWSLTPAPQRPVMRWRATLDVPPDRVSILAQALAIQDATLTAGEQLGTVRLDLTLRNQGRMPLQLRPADLVLTQDGRNLVFPDLAALRAPFASGETRTILLDIPLAGRQPIVLAAGADRLQLML